jgi:hypothetical protein
LILDGHSKDFSPAYYATLMLTQGESYQLYHVITKLVEINKMPVNTASAEIQGF